MSDIGFHDTMDSRPDGRLFSIIFYVTMNNTQQIVNYLLAKDTSKETLEPELFFGITYLLGAENEAGLVIDELRGILENKLAYNVCVIDVADIITEACSPDKEELKYKGLMKQAEDICKRYKTPAALMPGVIDRIIRFRKNHRKHSRHRNAYIINAIKRPGELNLLKKVYREALFLIGLYMPENERKNKLMQEIGEQAEKDKLMQEIEVMMHEDEKSPSDFGTNSKDVYHQADVLIDVGSCSKQYPNSAPNARTRIINRLIHLIFGNPYCTPTFAEHAMFMAFSNSIHSSDLSRQVGAALCVDGQIISLGANECHQPAGLPYFENDIYSDTPYGKDYTIGYDSNAHMIKDIIDKLKRVNDGLDEKKTYTVLRREITEFGRMLHAEMDAITDCARRGVSTLGGVLYCTTFPCHNCAKHIVAAGIKHIYFIEPYPKSKALDLFKDSIVYHYDQHKDDRRVILEPYTGITAKRYHDFFTMKSRYGAAMIRKNKETGETIPFDLNKHSKPRFVTPWISYKNMEQHLSEYWQSYAQQSPTKT